VVHFIYIISCWSLLVLEIFEKPASCSFFVVLLIFYSLSCTFVKIFLTELYVHSHHQATISNYESLTFCDVVTNIFLLKEVIIFFLWWGKPFNFFYRTSWVVICTICTNHFSRRFNYFWITLKSANSSIFGANLGSFKNCWWSDSTQNKQYTRSDMTWGVLRNKRLFSADWCIYIIAWWFL